MNGLDFIQRVSGLTPGQRQDVVYAALTGGAMPHWLLQWVPVTYVARDGAGHERRVTVRVLPDYLAVGDAQNFVRVPMFPRTAQRVADYFAAALPTPAVVRRVYAAATAKLHANPTGTRPKEAISTIAWNSSAADEQMHALGIAPGALAAGHKKDIVVARALASHPHNVLIYGWFRADGSVIQGEPLFTGHSGTYEDYSHGVRLVDSSIEIDGQQADYHASLASPLLAPLLSDEGVVVPSRYDAPPAPAGGKIGGGAGLLGVVGAILGVAGLAAGAIYWRLSLLRI